MMPGDGHESNDDQEKKKLNALQKVKAKIGSKKSKDGQEEEALANMLKNNRSLDEAVLQGKFKSVEDMLKSLSTEEVLTGLAPTGKNNKDMADYKFWSTQPVARFDEQVTEEGAIESATDVIPDQPIPLLSEFEWVTMDLDNAVELKEVYDLLSLNYVEDDQASFRFDYSAAFLHWALQAPGFKKDWHIGVRVKASKRLVAFISGIPITLQARSSTLQASEINFLCVHKKLRSKRLAPTLIKEVTRRCHKLGIWQAVYTAGVVLPKPITSCRYYHRTLDWQKLHDVGFTGLPARSTKARQITKFKLPAEPHVKGVRPMTDKDVAGVGNLLKRTLGKFSIYQVFSDADIKHWFLTDPTLSEAEQVVWTYVVEQNSKVTDFYSFYSLPSSVIGNMKHKKLNAAYLFYYGSDTIESSTTVYHDRLKILITDAMIFAKKLNFDVFNALTLMDNPSFLEDLKFGPGDGFLNYYLYNWKIKPISGGMTIDGQLHPETSDVGLVML